MPPDEGAGLVFVAGALHHDVVVRAERLPMLDETLPGSQVSYIFGGKGGNQAVAARRAGARVAMAGAVGDDEAGRFLRARLTDAGIDHAQVKSLAGVRSGMSVAIVDSRGDYGAVIVSGANRLIEAADVTLPEETAVLLLQNEIPDAVNLALAQKARRGDVLVMLNAAPVRSMPEELAGCLDILVVNSLEAQQLAGEAVAGENTAVSHGYAWVRHEVMQRASRLLRRHAARAIVVTLGGDGVVFVEASGAPVHAAAPKVDVVSTHGAGDVFCGTLAAMLARGNSLSEAIDRAMERASRHVAHRSQEDGW